MSHLACWATRYAERQFYLADQTTPVAEPSCRLFEDLKAKRKALLADMTTTARCAQRPSCYCDDLQACGRCTRLPKLSACTRKVWDLSKGSAKRVALMRSVMLSIVVVPACLCCSTDIAQSEVLG